METVSYPGGTKAQETHKALLHNLLNTYKEYNLAEINEELRLKVRTHCEVAKSHNTHIFITIV